MSAYYKQLCWEKRLLLIILPSAAYIALLPEVITHVDLLAEQLVQTFLYYSWNEGTNKDSTIQAIQADFDESSLRKSNSDSRGQF